MHLSSVQISFMGVLQGASGLLLCRLVILFAALLRRSAMSVGRNVM
jgi:hypothetical protein